MADFHENSPENSPEQHQFLRAKAAFSAFVDAAAKGQIEDGKFFTPDDIVNGMWESDTSVHGIIRPFTALKTAAAPEPEVEASPSFVGHATRINNVVVADISAEILSFMIDSNLDIVAIDVRGFFKYDIGHISGACCMSLPRHFKSKRITLERIEKLITGENTEAFLERKEKDIVLYNQSGDEQYLKIFRNLLVDEGIANSVLTLEGGYDAFETLNADPSCGDDVIDIIPATSTASSSEVSFVDANCVNDRIWIGGVTAASNLSFFEREGITDVLDCAGFENYHSGKKIGGREIKYRRFALPDDPDADITQHFEGGGEFIHAALQEDDRRILVHCQAGISRSSTMLIAYFMRYEEMTLDDAYRLLLDCRDVAPNPGFMSQLIAYEIELRGESSMQKYLEYRPLIPMSML
jgi:rhodanese-related sulfurtransferase